MLINELSKQTGITIHTIRYYENLGLIQGGVDKNVKTNNYRIYDESHVERLSLIKEAQEVGFTLAEIRSMLEKWYSGKFPKKEQLRFVDVKMEEIEARIRQLKLVKKRLEGMRKEIERGEC